VSGERSTSGAARRPGELPVPELSLVVLVGVSGSGKSTFARAHFSATEVISSDFCRGLVADDANDQSVVLTELTGRRPSSATSLLAVAVSW
jgi:protein phosphatase